jgi:hypothetical protein
VTSPTAANASSTLCWCLPGSDQRTCSCSCSGDVNGNKPTALICTFSEAVTSSVCQCESGVRRLYDVCRCERAMLPTTD